MLENSSKTLVLDYIEDNDYDSPLLKARTKQIFHTKSSVKQQYNNDKLTKSIPLGSKNRIEN